MKPSMLDEILNAEVPDESSDSKPQKTPDVYPLFEQLKPFGLREHGFTMLLEDDSTKCVFCVCENWDPLIFLTFMVNERKSCSDIDIYYNETM